MFLIIPLFGGLLIPVYCVGILLERKMDPSIQALALLILSPYVYFLIRILRINL